jgi:hypothetical protein
MRNKIMIAKCGIFISKHITVSESQCESSYYGSYSCTYKVYTVFWSLASSPAWAETQDTYLLGLLDIDIPSNKEDGGRVASNISQTFKTKCTSSEENSPVAILK